MSYLETISSCYKYFLDSRVQFLEVTPREVCVSFSPEDYRVLALSLFNSLVLDCPVFSLSLSVFYPFLSLSFLLQSAFGVAAPLVTPLAGWFRGQRPTLPQVSELQVFMAQPHPR